jgi:hypothetical protein
MAYGLLKPFYCTADKNYVLLPKYILEGAMNECPNFDEKTPTSIIKDLESLNEMLLKITK